MKIGDKGNDIDNASSLVEENITYVEVAKYIEHVDYLEGWQKIHIVEYLKDKMGKNMKRVYEIKENNGHRNINES